MKDLLKDPDKWNQTRKDAGYPEVVISEINDLVVKGCNLKHVTFTDCWYGQFTGCESGQFTGCGYGQFVFSTFPSVSTLAKIGLNILSPEISLELMRRDAFAHPHPERFDEWADGAPCPYQEEEYFWHFNWDAAKQYWKTGNPTMRDSDLILAICKEKGWKIRGYLE